jgi:geranylgeranyl pyrophosphate synthase
LATSSDRKRLLDLLNGEPRRPDLFGPYLQRYDDIDYTRRRARGFIHRARQRLNCLPPSPERDILTAMTEFVVSRSM